MEMIRTGLSGCGVRGDAANRGWARGCWFCPAGMYALVLSLIPKHIETGSVHYRACVLP